MGLALAALQLRHLILCLLTDFSDAAALWVERARLASIIDAEGDNSILVVSCRFVDISTGRASERRVLSSFEGAIVLVLSAIIRAE